VRFTPTKISGTYIIDIIRLEDNRGFFGRTWCQREFDEHELNSQFVQCNISFNIKCGTIRGMHYQIHPFEEAKLVRCTMGAIYDVIIDLRPHSPTYKNWLAIEMTAESRRALYIPEGTAHGFQTLTDNAEVFYQMSEFHQPDAGRGIRWNDPEFNIDWPINKIVISEKDSGYPNWFDNE
jgi:dTDP-4-dehydrorhamnose 3,5-epimerase